MSIAGLIIHGFCLSIVVQGEASFVELSTLLLENGCRDEIFDASQEKALQMPFQDQSVTA